MSLGACTGSSTPTDGAPSDAATSDTSQSDPSPDTGATGLDTASTTPGPDEVLQFVSGSPPSNLLMISIDTLRTDHADGTAGRMPFLSAKAAEGVSFPDSSACSNWTLASTTCVMGGRSTVDLGEETGLFPDIGPRQAPLTLYPEGTEFMADWLGDAGFYTMMVTANPLFGPDYAQARGFDVTAARVEPADWVTSIGRTMLDNQLADNIGPDQPWYQHLHFYDPHRTYRPPEAYQTVVDGLDPIPYDVRTEDGHSQALAAIRFGLADETEAALIVAHLTALYEAETLFLDDTLAAYWADMEASGLLDDTLVIVWTDHGEQFFEHGEQLHGNLLYGEENDAVFFVWAADLAPAVSDLPTAHVDIAPTVLDLYGVPQPPEVTGLPLNAIGTDRTRFSHTVGKQGPIAAASSGRYKIHWAFADPAQTTEEGAIAYAGRTAYDRVTDPLETTAIWDEDDPELQALWQELKAEVARMEPYIVGLGFAVLWID